MATTSDSQYIKIVELNEAKASLGELIAGLEPGHELLVVRDHQPLARVVPSVKVRPKFGSCKGLLTIIKDDDEYLNDFED